MWKTRGGYARFPRRVVDDLVTRNSVIRAEDVAGRLARVVKEPETFLRLYRAAMTHPDLVVLSERDRSGVRVYTTRDRLTAELDAVDLGTRLALSPAPATAPKLTLGDLARRDRSLEARLEQEMPPPASRGAGACHGTGAAAAHSRGSGQRQGAGGG